MGELQLLANWALLRCKKGVQRTIGEQRLYANRPLNPQTWRHDKTPNTLSLNSNRLTQ